MSFMVENVCHDYREFRIKPLHGSRNRTNVQFSPAPRAQPSRLDGWWTQPYFSCPLQKWLLSYSLIIPPSPKGHYSDLRGLISIDIEITDLRVNQCHGKDESTHHHQTEHARTAALHLHWDQDIEVFYGSHKCHRSNMKVGIFAYIVPIS